MVDHYWERGIFLGSFTKLHIRRADGIAPPLWRIVASSWRKGSNTNTNKTK